MGRPRIRTVKPEFSTDGKIRRLSDSTALFFILLWNHCDDLGYFELDTLELSSKLPRWRSQDISKMISALHGRELVKLSRAVGVGLVATWGHQRIDKPQPSKWQGTEIKWDDASEISDASQINPRKERKGTDRKVPERKVPSTVALAPEDCRFDFASIAKEYPNPKGRSEGVRRLSKLVTTPEAFERFSKAVRNYAEQCRIDGTELRFMKHFSSFVGTDRTGQPWEDFVEFTPVRASPLASPPGPRNYALEREAANRAALEEYLKTVPSEETL